MANEEHLSVLRQGANTWNQWRWEHVDARPDLSGADLNRANLAGTNLAGTNLAGTNLIYAILSEANLLNADLTRADLTGADLIGANLGGVALTGADLTAANLNGANLTGADLTGADLTEAVLYRADLRGVACSRADLHQAIVGLTIFDNLDLSDVEGLDTLKHRRPSTVGIDTIYRSRGRIPDAFLRGIGAPDTFITFAHSLVAAETLIQYYSCFISYSTADQDLATRLYNDLQAAGVRCWFAPEDLRIGDPFRDRIHDAIRLHEKLLVILSEHSVASSRVEEEVTTAIARERREHRLLLYPVRVDDTVMATDRAWAETVRDQRHIGDFTHWKDHDAYQTAFQRLLRDLKSAPDNPTATPSPPVEGQG